ncbi:uncharacterized protein EI90DRAFT_2977229 [Cantharellus anzutake]|uniref:uncharacterized protein n=1 Tax=Cantharellus anzutake TaxID=1750568 RepID=UPI001908CF51|nr:uncharacterized protein EI90DRAFT_2977229 [Cantharellus anzutake]KAF8324303.1 hypothetical protein EI90DRAFT_2977229 [Cantharellus anzutake]
MPFGEVVIGSPGSGKSTYAYGKYQLLSALERKCVVINLDPANDHVQYPCAIDINELITVPQVMREYELGPNGAMLFCMEYLEANFDWLEERLKAEGIGEDDWVIFDCPGQVELSTNHNSLKNITERLGKFGFRLAVVHLCDAHYVTDASKYVSVLLLSLRAMLHLGLPHINVLSKLDLIKQYGELSFNLDFYTEVQDLSYLQHALSESSPKFAQLNMRICELIEDYNYVAFETLAVEDKQSMIHLMRTIDRALGYAFVATVDDASVAISPAGAPRTKVDNRRALFSSAASVIPDVPNIQDIQERWVDHRDEYDEWEEGEWRREGVAISAGKARADAKKR